MTIIVKNKQTLLYKDFVFKCCIGKNGFTKNKIEGDGKTPSGLFKIENLFSSILIYYNINLKSIIIYYGRIFY